MVGLFIFNKNIKITMPVKPAVNDVLKYISLKKIIIPILLGLSAVGYMLYIKIDTHTFSNIHWTTTSTIAIAVALGMLALRDFAYMIRLRILSKAHLSWKQCFEVVFCWEFASAVAPGAIGGGFAFAIFAIHKEKIPLGKSAAIVLLTSFFDGLFFIVGAPVLYAIFTKQQLFYNVTNSVQIISNSEALHSAFWSIYGLVVFYKIVVGYALFVDASAVKKGLQKLFSIPFLQRWQAKAVTTGDELIVASKELKKESAMYYIGGFAATVLSWTARFTIVNCVIAAFSTAADVHHLLLFARQIVVGILMMGTPTPGGAGLAELSFGNFYGEFINNAGLTVALALLWRMLSYYPYLIMGAIVVPRWVRRVFA
jgi:glycosyltransferase 2 family protein